MDNSQLETVLLQTESLIAIGDYFFTFLPIVRRPSRVQEEGAFLAGRIGPHEPRVGQRKESPRSCVRDVFGPCLLRLACRCDARREAVTAFVASGQKQGMLRDTLLRALLNEVIAAYQEYRSNTDITHELSFLIDQLNDDVGPITRES